MRKFFSRYKKNESGQGLVEFALVLPILMLVIMGIIQFAAVFGGQLTVTSAAREAARLAVVGEDYNVIKTNVANSSAALLMNLEADDISITPANPDVGDYLTATVTGTVRVIVPGFTIFTGNTFTVSSASEMRVEYQP